MFANKTMIVLINRWYYNTLNSNLKLCMLNFKKNAQNFYYVSKYAKLC